MERTYTGCNCATTGTRDLDVPHLDIGAAAMFGIGLILTFAVSLWFALMIDFTLSAIAISVAVIFAHYKCSRCMEPIESADLSEREARSLLLQRGVAVCLIAGMLFVAHWGKQKWDAERGVGRPAPAAVVEEEDTVETEPAYEASE
jgi:membrane protein implicated in regulation of membrane protease activity